MLETTTCPAIVSGFKLRGSYTDGSFKAFPSLVCSHAVAVTTAILFGRSRLDGEMLTLQRIKELWRGFFDPVEKTKRKQLEQSQKIAKILDENRQAAKNFLVDQD